MENVKRATTTAATECAFPHVDVHLTHWIRLFAEFMLKNKPCILRSSATRDWSCRKHWVTELPDGTASINLDYIRRKYGDMQAPLMDAAYTDYHIVQLREYINYVSDHGDTAELKYVKDWHFQKESGTFYEEYGLPSFLRFDWINNEKWSDGNANPFGDYRFVYFGVKDTWTIFHSDVMSSYSWSANICGRKLWYFVPPGNEEFFRKDRNGFLEDVRDRKEKWTDAGVISFVQEPGEIVFVPSNWYHQVHNLEDAISINHNFINASNVNLIYALICARLPDVRDEISDVKDVFSKEEFELQCQLILKADIRVNFDTLRRLVELVIADRSRIVDECWVCAEHPGRLFECKRSDACLDALCARVEAQCECALDSDSICAACERFINAYELSCACECLAMISAYEDANAEGS